MPPISAVGSPPRRISASIVAPVPRCSRREAHHVGDRPVAQLAAAGLAAAEDDGLALEALEQGTHDQPPEVIVKS
jgi:hypothetical protein